VTDVPVFLQQILSYVRVLATPCTGASRRFSPQGSKFSCCLNTWLLAFTRFSITYFCIHAARPERVRHLSYRTALSKFVIAATTVFIVASTAYTGHDNRTIVLVYIVHCKRVNVIPSYYEALLGGGGRIKCCTLSVRPSVRPALQIFRNNKAAELLI